LSQQYTVREFAELASVTVRTLHHYERLGLLKPRRSRAGYRLYTLRELERLEQIVALKFLGVPLKQIKSLLDRDPLALPEALRVQLKILEGKRQLLDRAIYAISEAIATIQSGKPAGPALLQNIIGVIKMQNDIDFRQKYFSQEAWMKLKKIDKQASFEERMGKPRAWINLICDVKAAIEEDPASEKAQALAARWMEQIETSSHGDSGIKAGWTNAWRDREHWPAADRSRIESYDLEEIVEFIGKAMSAPMKKYYLDEAWTKLMNLQKQPDREELRKAYIELYRDIEAALEENPSSPKAQALAARWIELSEAASGGDAEIQTGGRRALEDRHNWPTWLQHQAAARYDLTYKVFDRVVTFAEKAIAQLRK